MSRIEEALEKAAKLREGGGNVQPPAVAPEVVAPATRFEEGAGVVNPAMVDRHVVSITDPYSSAAEQYKKLRAKVLKATTASKSFLNSIMVTSAEMKEGKTITAINLAVSLAGDMDYTVMLIDADLRKPSVHRYLGIDARYGLSEYLRGKAEIHDIIVRTGIGKLAIIPAGEPPENPSELLSSDRMKRLVAEMKTRYRDRYLIFDSSPLLVTADPMSLGGYMDGVLYVVQEGRTSIKEAQQSLSLMKGWNVIGVVLNNVLKTHDQNRYGEYYSYGYYGKTTNGNGKNGSSKT